MELNSTVILVSCHEKIMSNNFPGLTGLGSLRCHMLKMSKLANEVHLQ